MPSPIIGIGGGGGRYSQYSTVGQNQPLTDYSPETQEELARQERRRQVMTALMQQGMAEKPATVSTGRFLVPRHWAQNLGDLAQTALGAYGISQAEQATAAAVAEQQKKREATIDAYTTLISTPPADATTAAPVTPVAPAAGPQFDASGEEQEVPVAPVPREGAALPPPPVDPAQVPATGVTPAQMAHREKVQQAILTGLKNADPFLQRYFMHQQDTLDKAIQKEEDREVRAREFSLKERQFVFDQTQAVNEQLLAVRRQTEEERRNKASEALSNAELKSNQGYRDAQIAHLSAQETFEAERIRLDRKSEENKVVYQKATLEAGRLKMGQEAAKQRAEDEYRKNELAVQEGRLALEQNQLKETTRHNKALEGIRAANVEKNKPSGGEVEELVETLRDQYNQLRAGGGIVDTEKGAVSNITSSMQGSLVGQAIGGAVGTENQSLRNAILQTRPLLMQAVAKKLGLTARQLDSNVELKMWLAAATDPTKDYQANMTALDTIIKYVSGGKPAGDAKAGDAKAGNATAGWTPQDQARLDELENIRRGKK